MDHAVVQPRTLKLVGWVSDLLAPEGRRGNPSRGSDAWFQLNRLVESREPFLVVTLLAFYPSMLITSLKAPVDRTTGRALRFEMELEEVQFRSLERGQRPPPVRIGPAEDRSEEVERGKLSVVVVPVTSIDRWLWQSTTCKRSQGRVNARPSSIDRWSESRRFQSRS